MALSVLFFAADWKTKALVKRKLVPVMLPVLFTLMARGALATSAVPASNGGNGADDDDDADEGEDSDAATIGRCTRAAELLSCNHPLN